ncbi:hypothetical protein J437_LFUL017282 [Ladona fulva]|uniref:C-type lectin domain-containing protein n=1 Tax=Ladona fulva TaxID=123851 RepID=A0A8K0P5M5_LADFU|nr:hypothetical protein J437_LFUL017282 [Ladona fulva]
MKQTAKDLPEIWKVDVEHEITESEGLRTSNLLAVLTVPPQLPTDYKLIPGIGYYKFHNETARNFDDAEEICSKEGGHLAIINSEEESNALKGSIYGFAYIGFHDRIKEGEFITIFGQSLKYTGFNRWSASYEPNGGTSENCGSLHPNGGINDISCNINIPFICEYDLSWIDG